VVKINPQFVCRDKNGILGVDASDAGLAPGDWPNEVELNKKVFIRKAHDPNGNWFYLGPKGEFLVIMND
jgi:hypothetical protein